MTSRFCVADLKAYLLGTWGLERDIEDRKTGQKGRFDGEASWKEKGGTLVYRESGIMHLGGLETEAERVLLYLFPEPGMADVRFQDGRPFHDLDLSDGAWAARHDCSPDVYQGSMQALSGRLWQVVWVVSGPRKDLTLTSRYARG